MKEVFLQDCTTVEAGDHEAGDAVEGFNASRLTELRAAGVIGPAPKKEPKEKPPKADEQLDTEPVQTP